MWIWNQIPKYLARTHCAMMHLFTYVLQFTNAAFFGGGMQVMHIQTNMWIVLQFLGFILQLSESKIGLNLFGAFKHIYCFKSRSPKNTVSYLSSFQSKPEWLLFTGNLNFWVKPCSYHCAFSLLRWSDPHLCSLRAHVPVPFPFGRSHLATPLQWHCSGWACIKFHHRG